MTNWENFPINNAEILAVGTEILIGQIVNTNASFLAEQLHLLGINCLYQNVVGDNKVRLEKALKQAAERSDLVLVTGGLGPTADDITMEIIAKTLGQELILDQEVLKGIEEYFHSSGRKMAVENKKQAYFPEEAEILPNYNGTAPGAIVPYTKNGNIQSIFVVLPGPPNENKPMFIEQIAPILQDHSDYRLESTFIRTIGIGESDACSLLGDLLDEGHSNPTLAPYAQTGEVYFRLTYRHKKNDEDRSPMQEMLSKVEDRLHEYIYEIGKRSLLEVTSDLLKQKMKSLAVVESCTSGKLAASFGTIAGISSVFCGGLVAYQTRVKEDVLKIDSKLLTQYGTISKECAQAMVEAGSNLFTSDYTLAITGNAGPDAVEGKKVGLVYIACKSPKNLYVHEYNLRGNREKVQELACKRAINLLRTTILEEEEL